MLLDIVSALIRIAEPQEQQSISTAAVGSKPGNASLTPNISSADRQPAKYSSFIQYKLTNLRIRLWK